MAMVPPAPVAIGNGKLLIADVCAVAVLRAKVLVDSALLASTSTSKTGEASASGSCANPTTSASEAVSKPIARGVLVILLHRLLRLKQSSTVVEAILFVAHLLNHDVIPLLARDSTSANALLIGAMSKQSMVYGVDAPVPIDVALQAISIDFPTTLLSSVEQSIVCRDAPVGLAEAVLAVGGARSFLPMADAIAACTCEAVHANVVPFEADFMESSRPHRGMVTSASNLRLMLDNSKFVHTSKADPMDAPCIRAVPQYHGPVRDAITVAFKTLEDELNAGSVDHSTMKVTGTFHPQVVQTVLASTMEALAVLRSACVERITLVRTMQSSAFPALASIPLSPEAANDAVGYVHTVASLLGLECAHAMAYFDQEEEEMKTRLAEKTAKAQEAAAKAAAAQAKEDEKLAAMSEAQRAKVLEKRRKKMEKQKGKDQAKQSARDELKLGAGCMAVRVYLKQALERAGASQAMEHVLNPFELRPMGTTHFLDELFVRLGSGGARRKPKIAKGAQDFLPHQMHLREKIFNKIRMVFKRHAGVEIETPVFELKETLTGKYGEDSKLIYDLADQGGELLALRYDLTVPFARFMALHNPGNIKRFHIARVYRRDNPQMARGRFREFYQCDFDIAGTYAPMIPDAEVLSIGIEVLQQFPELGPFKVKLSHRLLLDAILALCGVPSDKFRTTCSAIDKLDKEPWATVRAEMVEEKGLAEDVADRIQRFVCRVGNPRELHTAMMEEKLFGDHPDAAKAMADLGILFDYLDAMGVLDYISFDLSLARGLDYYTGLIYEFVLTSPDVHVGSIAAGGRYDNLVGMFSATGQQIPCVGVSMGIERIFGLLQAHAEKASQGATASSQVLVASTGSSLVQERLEICRELWQANIAAEIMQQETPKFTKQLHYALESGIPYMVIIGEDELKQQQVKVKIMSSKEEITLPRAEMVAELLRRQCATTDMLSI